jgi:drug/metabolite transporter (DMT)-like permease
MREIVFWRSVFMAAFVAVVLAVLHGSRMLRAVGRLAGVVSGLFPAGVLLFIGSLTRTTVANTFVLIACRRFSPHPPAVWS